MVSYSVVLNSRGQISWSMQLSTCECFDIQPPNPYPILNYAVIPSPWSKCLRQQPVQSWVEQHKCSVLLYYAFSCLQSIKELLEVPRLEWSL